MNANAPILAEGTFLKGRSFSKTKGNRTHRSWPEAVPENILDFQIQRSDKKHPTSIYTCGLPQLRHEELEHYCLPSTMQWTNRIEAAESASTVPIVAVTCLCRLLLLVAQAVRMTLRTRPNLLSTHIIKFNERELNINRGQPQSVLNCTKRLCAHFLTCRHKGCGIDSLTLSVPIHSIELTYRVRTRDPNLSYCR